MTRHVHPLASPLLLVSLSLSACTIASAQQETRTLAKQTSSAATTTAPEPWKKIPIPPLHDFKPVQPKRIDLPNGMVIFLQEDHELPFIDGNILIRGGSRDEPAGKIGLTSLYGESWRTSGSVTTPGDTLDTQLAAKAASIETGNGVASTTLDWSCLKEDFDSVFGSALDLLLHPAFKPEKLQLAQRQIDTGISRRNDDAGSIASREASMLIYGPNSPYGRHAEYATVNSVTLDDLKAWHDRTVVAGGMILAVSGDFDASQMEAKLRKAFEPLPRGQAIAPLQLTFPGPKPGIYFADKEDINQSTVRIVGLGTDRRNPDYYALSVMNEIFSGGFGSRVVQAVRTRLGLAYSVGGSFGAAYDHPGAFYSAAGTKSVSTVAATKAILEEIGRLKTVPPTPEEMRSAKDEELNSFIFRYDSREKTLNEQVTLAFYGYPPDFLERYKTGIEKVTAADVTRVADKYIDVSKLAIVIVGNKTEMTPALSTLGPVTNLDIAIPTPPGTNGKATQPPASE